MSIITKAISKIMHLGDLEEPAEESNPEERPAEQPQEEAKPEEAPQEQPAPEPSKPEPAPEQPALEPPPAEPSTPEAPKQQVPNPQPSEGLSLSPNQRVDAAYKLVYGENGEVPTRHESIVTAEAAEWQIRYYMGGLFAEPNDHPLAQKFSNVDELLTWFNEAYPLQ